ncbi:MAG: glycosyltransferase family 2 protein [Candidatus Levybacteria bacterium]|nr:glycosyltransferase family 2 protein [Candidatus Levybacteria bacterium]
MVDVSIIIVSFNTKDLTIECIRSVIRTIKRASFEIIIVDNNSEDDSVEEVQMLKVKSQNFNSKVKIIENKENVGFSKANNIGVEEASGRFVLFLNSDTVVYENTIDGMVEFMDRNNDAGAATCFVRLPNGKLDDAAHRGFPTPFRALSHFSGASKIFKKSKLFGGYNLRYLDLDKTHEVDALAGAFMLVRREAGEQAGWWDEDFFWYGDDLDFCYRLREKSWKIYFVPKFEILHYKGASGGIKKHSKLISAANSETKKRAHEARFAAMGIFYDKHYKNKYPSIIRMLVLTGIALKKRMSSW